MSSDAITSRTALSDLSTHVDELLRLDLSSSPDSTESIYRFETATSAIVASIAAAKERGVPSSAIDATMAPLHAALRGCEFYRRTHTWPRGYPGDFETVEMLCHPQKFTKERLSWADWAQEFALAHPSVQQHRNKIVKQAVIILEETVEATANTRILSVGCGGCADLRMILPVLRNFPGRFVLVDIDEDALAFSRGQLGALADSCDFVKLNALRYIKRAARKEEMFDLVYAGGLLDYFDDDAVAFFLGNAYQTLRPGGRLFFTNVAEGNRHMAMIEYFARWSLITRSEASVLDLCTRANIDPSLAHIERDATGMTLLVDLKKP